MAFLRCPRPQPSQRLGTRMTSLQLKEGAMFERHVYMFLTFVARGAEETKKRLVAPDRVKRSNKSNFTSGLYTCHNLLDLKLIIVPKARSSLKTLSSNSPVPICPCENTEHMRYALVYTFALLNHQLNLDRSDQQALDEKVYEYMNFTVQNLNENQEHFYRIYLHILFFHLWG